MASAEFMSSNNNTRPEFYSLCSVPAHKAERLNECIIVNFQNGKLRPDKASKVKFGLFRHKKKSVKRYHEKRILVAETEKMSYVGDNFGTFSSKESQMGIKYMVGVRNKETGKMTLHDSKLFHLQPKKPGQDDIDEGEGDAKNSDLSFVEKNDLLTDAFGSSRKRRAMESRLRNKIKGEALEKAVDSAVKHTMNNPALQSSLVTASQQHDSLSLIPPYHLDAATPQQAYLVQDLISHAEFDAMKTAVKVFTEASREQIKQWKSEESYPTNILFHLSVMPIETAAREHKASCLLYLHYMLKLYSLRSNDLKAKDPLPKEIPEIIRTNLLDKFTLPVQLSTKTVRAMPARLKDKLACYIITLSLILDEFNMDITNLQKDLKINFTKISTLLRALGCTIKSQTIDLGVSKMTVKMAELKVPLTFPDPAANKAKKGRS